MMKRTLVHEFYECFFSFQMYNNTINQEQDVLEANTARRNNIDANLRNLKSKISQIDGKAADSLAVYGRDMPKLAARIKQLTEQGKFSKLPRGPLGHYIQVPDRKWRAVVEQAIGNHLRTFCVNSDGDRILLDKLFREEYPQLKSTIITGKFGDRVYDVSNGRVQAVQNTQTMMSVLKVSDVVVMNCLIDQVRVESILLVEDQALATHITADEENIPHNLSKVILLKPLSEIFPAPAYRSYALAERQVRFIQVNTAEQKRQFSLELLENGQKRGAVEAEVKESNTKLANLKRSLAQRQQQLKSMETDKRQLTNKINELKAVEYPSDQDNELLQNELVELKASIAEVEATLAAEKAKLKALEEKEEEIDAKLKMSKAKKRQIDGQIQTLQDSHDAERAKLLNLDNKDKYNRNLLKTYNDERAVKKAEFEKKKKDHAAISQQAAQFGTRTDCVYSPADLTRTIKSMEKRIR
jgi:structural maintenance of chromosomes protein 6